MSACTQILIAHDDDDGRFLIRRAIQASFPKAVILEARDGTEALAVMARIAVDAVVTDQKMGAVSGTELVRQIRATGSQIPILMTTGDDSIAPEAVSAGVTEFYGSKDWAGVGAALKACEMR